MALGMGPVLLGWAALPTVYEAAADTQVVALVPSDDRQLAAPASRSAPLTAQQVLDMTRRAVDLIGGMGSVVPDTARLVVIKPNIVTLDPSGSGVVTDARVVRAVALLVHEAAPHARVLIAEGAAGWLPPNDGFETAGHRATVSELRARGIDIDCLDLNQDAAVALRVPGGGLATDEYDMAATILQADVWINCPVAKTHGAKITCSMKNQIGVLPGRLYGWPKSGGTQLHPPMPHAPRVMDELLVDLLLLSRPDLNVVDMIAGVEAGGFMGEPKRSNLIVAGRDAVATDLVVARLMGFNPRDLEFAELALQRGVGPGSIDHIHLRGADVGPLINRFKKAGLSYGYVGTYGEFGEHANYGMGPRRWTLLGPMADDHTFTERQVEDLDPRPGRDGWSPVTWFGHDKIDLDAFYGDPVHACAYAFTRFTMDRPDSVRFWIGSDEGLQVWVDGKSIYRHSGRRHHRLGQDRLPGYLQSGEHRLLVRAEQGRGAFDFSFNICEPVDDELFAGNTHAGIRYHLASAEHGAPVQVRARDVFDGEYVSEHASTLDRPGRPSQLPDSVLIPAPPTPAVGGLLNVLATVAGLPVSAADSADLACMSLTPFGLAFTALGRETPFPAYGPEPVRLLGWLGLDYAVTSGLGWREAVTEIEQWLTSGRVVVTALEGQWVSATGYRHQAGQTQLLVAGDWVTVDRDWWGLFPGEVWVNCPVVVVEKTHARLVAAVVADSMASLALEMGLRDSVPYAPDWWDASPAPAGLTAWDAWVTYWERLPWTPEWAADPVVIERLADARRHLEQQSRERGMAAESFARAAAPPTGDRHPGLAEAARGYEQVAAVLLDLSQILPEDDENPSDEDGSRVAKISQARPMLRRAREAERRALQSLAEHLGRPGIPPVAADPLQQKAAGRKLFAWRADYNHGLYELTLVDDKLRQHLLSGRDADGVSSQVFPSPVRDPSWTVAVEVVKGDGLYQVVQQPTADNGWTTVVRVDDRLGDFREWWGGHRFETELIAWAVPASPTP